MTHSGCFGVWQDSDNFTGTLQIEYEEKTSSRNRKNNRFKRELTMEEEDDYDFVDKMIEEEQSKEKNEEKEEEKAEEDDQKQEKEDNEENANENELDRRALFEALLKDPKKITEDEEEKEKVVIKKKRQYHFSDIIDTSAQSILYPSSTSLTRGKRFLCWNLVGSVILR